MTFTEKQKTNAWGVPVLTPEQVVQESRKKQGLPLNPGGYWTGFTEKAQDIVENLESTGTPPDQALRLESARRQPRSEIQAAAQTELHNALSARAKQPASQSVAPAETPPTAKPTVTRPSVKEDLGKRYQQRLSSPEYIAARDQALLQSETTRGQASQDWMARTHPSYDKNLDYGQNLDAMAGGNPRYRKYLEDTAREAAGGKNVLDSATGRYFTNDQYNAFRERFPLPQDKGKTHVDITRGSQGTERANFMDGRYQGSSYQVAPQPIMGTRTVTSKDAEGNVRSREMAYNIGRMSEPQGIANTLNMTPEQLARMGKTPARGAVEPTGADPTWLSDPKKRAEFETSFQELPTAESRLDLFKRSPASVQRALMPLLSEEEKTIIRKEIEGLYKAR